MASVMEYLGFRPGRIAFLAGIAELTGGLFLALGLLTPLASSLAVAVMVVAAVSAHWRNGLFVTKGGIEYPFVLAATAAGLAFRGPGALSADESLGLVDARRRRHRARSRHSRGRHPTLREAPGSS